MFITEQVKYVGVNDHDIDLFESQYIVKNGVSYNSYLILDEKVALMDTVDARKTEEWLGNVEETLAGRTIDYIVVQHMEPDHSGSLSAVMAKYPEAVIVGNAKTFPFITQFFAEVPEEKKLIVKEGDVLDLGTHKLNFVMAPMVHWPEVMVTYESTDKLLFSADGFGKFGALDIEDEGWACEARRYYFNIVGKYGGPVQMLLKKAAALDIQQILPLHGPVLQDNLSYYIGLYDTWSAYKPETKGVFVAVASIHGNTRKAAYELAEYIRAAGEEKVVVSDLTRSDMAENVEDAFRYDRMVLMSSSYDGSAFAPMEDFLHHLEMKSYQNRTVAMVENGSWAPCAIRNMKKYVEGMKNVTILPETVTIRSSVKDADREGLKALAEAVVKAGN